jgi:hypothetical protein
MRVRIGVLNAWFVLLAIYSAYVVRNKIIFLLTPISFQQIFQIYIFEMADKTTAILIYALLI